MTVRWDHVTSLFWAARALEPHLRESFLKVACEDDVEMRREVDALLSTDTADDVFLEDAPWAKLGKVIAGRPLSPGEMLKDRYRVEEELATGGQAFVYRAHDQLLSRSVVIKLMRAGGLRNRLLKSHFEQEMRALAQIDHPGVVGILDVGELEDGSPFLVIQHVPGVSLRDALLQGPMAGPRAATILRQIGAALQAAHLSGVAHLDLKPENIMLQQHGGSETVRLIDFGIAKIDALKNEPHVTTVMVAGTVRYMAPEQLEGKNSSASDIYSLGLVACELLCGHPDVRALPRTIKRKTLATLEEALAFNPDERPADVQAWCERLAATLRGTPAPNLRRTVAMVGLLAILLVGTMAGAWWRLNNSAEPVRIIENVGAFDPVTTGFETHGDIMGTVAENATHTGYDAWRVFTTRQGYYFHSFTRSQKRRALERGWKLTAVMKVEEGGMTTGADFTGAGGRFDINVLLDGDREIVRLVTQIAPELRGLTVVQTPARAYHRYELIYDPRAKGADLWIDDERRLTGYHGHDQYLEDRGLGFGSIVYKTEQGGGSFQSVRFEISP